MTRRGGGREDVRHPSRRTSCRSVRRTGPRGAFAALSLAVLVGGCAASPGERPADGEDVAALAARRDVEAAALDTFRVRGGLGVRDGERSATARIDWRQSGAALDVGLAAPLGLGRARLIRRDGVARLERGEAAPVTGRSADEILQRALGLPVPVPLAQLATWIRGLPGDAHDVRRDDEGRLESLRWRDADGAVWQARVLDRSTVAGLSLPRLVTAQGSGYRLRLVLHDWTADDETSTPAVADPSAGAGTIGAGDAGASGGSIGPDAPPKRRVIPGR